jgi:excisionase family DNA binding protein
MSVFSPLTLAREMGCSERHIRNLIASGDLRAFRLGQKLWRIPAEAVEEFKCRTMQSAASEEASSSSIETSKESGTVTRLAPLTRAKLNTLRRRSTPS